MDTRLEKLKNNHVVISGTAPDQMVARLERRLQNGAFKADVALLAAVGRVESSSGGDD